MKKIDEYVNSVYTQVDRNEAKELKEEMRTHLLEAVEELKAQGISEEEAVSIALKNFGDEHMLRWKIVEHFRLSRFFSVNLLRTAIIFAVLSILIGCIFAYNEYRLFTQRAQIAQYTLAVLEDGGFNETNKELIVEFVKEAPQVTNMGIIQDHSDSLSRVFDYERSEPFKDIRYINGMAGKVYENGSWEVDMNYEHFHLAWIYAIGVCLFAYWVLFAIWATINANYYRRLNIGWILAFALSNVVGYLIYVLAGKRKVVEN
ncbi:permease prefix domain 1-containing protein [Psychrobacillus sp. L3]|uniref:permease prefix domain 1-containing protein n=1 Tax=Psychrobacillus sp. L3 TaxID=3236891 RepID=UPI0036F31527